MDMPDSNQNLAARVRVLQIIVGAMAIGVATFLIIAVTVMNPKEPNKDLLPVLTFASLGMLLMGGVGSFILPRLMISGARKKMTEEGVSQNGLLAALQVKTIVACAMLEGAAFMSIIAFIIEGRWWCLAGALLMLLGILYHMPTVARVQSWMDEQTRQIELERQLGGR
jgi:hypothetical protein